MQRPILAMLAPLVLGGCITSFPDITQSRSPCRNDPGGWCDFTREAAADSYGYAMLSSNAYDDEDTYTELGVRFEEVGIIPVTDEEQDMRDGLDYALYDEFEVRKTPEGFARGPRIARILAFRGTEFSSPTDIIYGSLRENQIVAARAVYAAERDRFAADYPDLPIVLTGHSLGGALSTQISIENPGVRAYVFNVSPFYRGDSATNDKDRVAISERGEFLRVLRRYRSPPAAQMLVINCAPNRSAGEKHGIRPLGDCLTWIAAYRDAYAGSLLGPNDISKPPVECGPADKVHPGDNYWQKEPCIHQPRPPEDDES
ncbi:alpha/beta hydrolase family protein [Parerythrobacter jejuensis]|uniref:Fungal lipase-like domain-containing protein n=1 Tax=Parerythrobacter jejuensis TaxID=795812 RepID=A0A845AUR9_9SPHN|nr:hypothetical protein [Parerythrobacter jejuensis]MXP32815.1 hypothetical protein [Parerythrobacter jejuensis]